MKELHPNLNEEDKDLIEKILSAGDIKHKYAVPVIKAQNGLKLPNGDKSMQGRCRAIPQSGIAWEFVHSTNSTYPSFVFHSRYRLRPTRPDLYTRNVQSWLRHHSPLPIPKN
jgi:hypothetical protein